MNKLVISVFVLMGVLLVLNVNANALNLENWGYRIPIDINLTDGNTSTNYSVNISIDTATLITAGKLNSDCSDIRFVNNTLDIFLGHWNETPCSSTGNTTFWVKVDVINTTIWMYYFNIFVTDVSNRSSAMAFYTNFTAGTSVSDDWKGKTGNFTITAESYLKSTADPSYGGIVIKDFEIGECEIKTKHNTTSTTTLSIGESWIEYDTPDFAWEHNFYTHEGFSYLRSFHDNNVYAYWNGSIINQTAFVLNFGKWTNTTFIIANGTASESRQLWKNDTLVTIYNGEVNTTRNVGINLRATGYDHYWEYFQVRAFHNPEPEFNVGSEELVRDIIVGSPENTTYCNNYSMLLNVSNVTFNVDTWLYSLKGASNITFDINTTFIPFLGQQNITIYANDTGGSWYNITIWFTLEMCCDGNYTGSTNQSFKCMGFEMSYTAPCVQLGYNLYQWDTTNMSLCEYGCRNGLCLNASYNVTCANRCSENETICSSDGLYVMPCRNFTTTSCFNWDFINKSRCQYGCLDGQCIIQFNFCQLNESKCEDNHIVYCDDDNNDGFYEWSEFNRTFCNYGCRMDFNSTNNQTTAECNYHSFNLTTAMRRGFDDVQMFIGTIFPASEPIAFMLMIFLMLFLSTLVVHFTQSWEIGLITAIVIMFLGTFLGMIPIFITIIFLIIGGAIFYKRI